MNKITIFIAFLSFAQIASAEQCSLLYQNKANEIAKAKAYDIFVGGGPYLDQANNLRISRGMPIPGKIDNWAQEFLDAIEFGPYTFIRTSGAQDPREEWLKYFKKSVKSTCPIKDDSNYVKLRSMLEELLRDGSFCPQNKILEPIKLSNFKKFLKGGSKGDFKQVLRDAVNANRFPELCKTNAVVDETYRKIKDTSSGTKAPVKKASTIPQ